MMVMLVTRTTHTRGDLSFSDLVFFLCLVVELS